MPNLASPSKLPLWKRVPWAFTRLFYFLKYYPKAQKAYNQQAYDQAELFLRQLRERIPFDPCNEALLANTLMLQTRYPEADEVLRLIVDEVDKRSSPSQSSLYAKYFAKFHLALSVSAPHEAYAMRAQTCKVSDYIRNTLPLPEYGYLSFQRSDDERKLATQFQVGGTTETLAGNIEIR